MLIDNNNTPDVPEVFLAPYRLTVNCAIERAAHLVANGLEAEVAFKRFCLSMSNIWLTYPGFRKLESLYKSVNK
jgi:hypothetical protein